MEPTEGKRATSEENQLGERSSRTAGIIAIVFIAIAVSLAASGIAVWITVGSQLGKEKGKPAYEGYAYRMKASDGVKLHMLVTEPDKVTLDAVRGNVSASPFYGINGGFFYNGRLLSMALVNDQPVGGSAGAYGSGSENVRVPRGTLVWDGAEDRLSVQVLSNPKELQVSDRDHYWAQGGISMKPKEEAGWRKQIEDELAPFPDDARLRTAAVYDTEGRLYLVVTDTKTTLAQFRTAIIHSIPMIEDGIFLDGDGSSQLRSFEASLSGDGRRVEQMIRLVRPNEKP
ncbi:conserved hypothetical protein [Paenibacillus curdlanolyticus YK9]|uniref:Phosphodiester glycosidase domain-containing protein n=1 Tax=Paenibacillus curdlanolyticus YK9 TaxID=717606 RepID=E0I4F7_9BACL|nr:phosphodiester glycosidase family protein [Paenibacillus curdlanolyticus]EFM13171.1 conserved hypothetical protein [Paenibacillus curdlanolyticus YK9]